MFSMLTCSQWQCLAHYVYHNCNRANGNVKSFINHIMWCMITEMTTTHSEGHRNFCPKFQAHAPNIIWICQPGPRVSTSRRHWRKEGKKIKVRRFLKSIHDTVWEPWISGPNLMAIHGWHPSCSDTSIRTKALDHPTKQHRQCLHTSSMAENICKF